MADRARSLLIKFLGDSKGLQGETDQVVGRLGKIKAAVGEADGVFGKLKAGGGAAMESIGGAGVLAGAAVTAAAAAAAKGLADFERLGTEIGKGAEATGLSTEAYSRWKEVTDDAGISASALDSVVGKFNKTAGASPQVLADLGVEIAKTKDGTTDVNETFLNAIDTLNGIQDPTARAAAGAKLFGRGWQEMGELIGRGSVALRTDLAAVSDAKVFDDDKVADARNLREAFDSIVDAGQDLFLTIGQTLAPVVADLAPRIAKVVEQVQPLAKGFGDLLTGALELIGPIVDLSNKLLGPLAEGLGKVATLVGDVVGGLGTMIDNVVGGGKPVGDLTDAVGDHIIAQQEQRTALQESNAAFDDAAAKAQYYDSRVEAAKDTTLEMVDAAKALSAELEDQSSWISAQQAVDDYHAKIAGGNLSLLERQAALVAVKQKLLDFTTSLEDVPAEKQTQIIALIEQGKIDEAEAALANLTRARNVPINPVTGGQMVDVASGRRAKGGPVAAGSTYIVGENGPEVLTMGSVGGNITPNHALGGGGLTFIVQGSVVGDAGLEQLLGDALAKMERMQRGNR